MAILTSPAREQEENDDLKVKIGLLSRFGIDESKLEEDLQSQGYSTNSIRQNVNSMVSGNTLRRNNISSIPKDDR